MFFRKIFSKKRIVSFLIVLLGVSQLEAVEDSSWKEEEQLAEELQMPVYVDDIAAIVNNEIITMTKLMREVYHFIPEIQRMSRTRADFQKKVRECQEFVLDAFIERILIVADFKSKGGQMSDHYEKKEFEACIHNRFNDDRMAFAEYLRSNGQSVREFKKDIRDHAIVNYVLAEVQKSKPEVSPTKIKEYYNEHIQDFILDRQIFVKEISLLKKNYTNEELGVKLSNLEQAIKSDSNIHSIIKNFSDSPKTSDIGWVCVDDMIPEFANALRGLEIGEYTIPIFLDNIVCILFVADEKPAKKFTLDEVSDDIENILTIKYQVEAKEHYIKKLKEKAYIKIFL
ncbi:MAG: SurA N-terminal domain-containing protein [Puniceicoccales bacterium]|jgi:peptidyl-prolyl cis-trans isomerase SurA|nr:SurA N-terminal domain-containing protein [Puniceicoccales bacterium]